MTPWSAAPAVWRFCAAYAGLFLVLPVFALGAPYPGGDDPRPWWGLALGVYGLVQALLQLPLGMASDFGRKRVIVLGLLTRLPATCGRRWPPTCGA